VAPAGNHSKHSQSPGNKIAKHRNLGGVTVPLHQYGCNSSQFNPGGLWQKSRYLPRKPRFFASSEQFSAMG
jgi:hypothetical protein